MRVASKLYTSSGMGGSVLSLLGMLLTVVLVLALAYWCTRLIGRRGLPGYARGPGGDKMQVLWQLSLGKAERLVMVKVDRRCLLLGVTSGGISLVTELSEEEAAAWLQSKESTARPENMPSFLDILRENLPKKK